MPATRLHHREEKVPRKNDQGLDRQGIVRKGKEKIVAEAEVLMGNHRQRKINDAFNNGHDETMALL